MKNLIKWRPPIYGKRTLRIALMSEVAKAKEIELTGEMSTRAEDILIQELRVTGLQKVSQNFIPLVLAALEVKQETPSK
jgi:hypothetical protein